MRGRRFVVEHLARRNFQLRGDAPYVSFTFDDYPRTALTEGGRILSEHGVRGTYFVSLGLLGTQSVSGPIATWADLAATVRHGHELGCHTFDHVDGSVVSADQFARSIEANRIALEQSAVSSRFDVFAYPLNGPALATKRGAGRRFVACRGGGQAINHGTLDLNLLKSYFLDARSRGRVDEVRRLIEANATGKGWLIFATHDVSETPSEYGCDIAYFNTILQLSLTAGARILPMAQVCRELGLVAAQPVEAAATVATSHAV